MIQRQIDNDILNLVSSIEEKIGSHRRTHCEMRYFLEQREYGYQL